MLTRGPHGRSGHIMWLGWTWGKAASPDMWQHSIVYVDDEALGACKPPIKAPVQPMPSAPRAVEHFGPGCDHYDVTFDPAAQHWFYDVEVERGGKQRMVRHWCASDWTPQEAFYK